MSHKTRLSRQPTMINVFQNGVTSSPQNDQISMRIFLSPSASESKCTREVELLSPNYMKRISNNRRSPQKETVELARSIIRLDCTSSPTITKQRKQNFFRQDTVLDFPVLHFSPPEKGKKRRLSVEMNDKENQFNTSPFHHKKRILRMNTQLDLTNSVSSPIKYNSPSKQRNTTSPLNNNKSPKNLTPRRTAFHKRTVILRQNTVLDWNESNLIISVDVKSPSKRQHHS